RSRAVPRPSGQRTAEWFLSCAAWLRLAVDDAPAGQVVRRELDLDPVAGVDPDPIPAHPAGRVAKRLVSVVEHDAVLPAPERLDDRTLDLDLLFLFRHGPPILVLPAARKAQFRAPTPPVV